MKRLILTLVISLVVLSSQAQDSRLFLNKLNIQLTARVQYYKENKVAEASAFKFKEKQAILHKSNATWQCDEVKRVVNNNYSDLTYSFQLVKGSATAAGVAVNFAFDRWGTDNYVIMPAAVYNGNRFDVLKYSYPPLFKKEDYSVDAPITITDVPRLNKCEGESRLDLNTGDLSTPSLGVYFPKLKKGIWILTEQATELGNSVLTLEENQKRTKAEFTIAAPCVREKVYGICRLTDSNETGVDWKQGDKVTIKCKVYIFGNINSPAELNKQFLSIRKSLGTSISINQLPFSKAFELMEEQQNREYWDEKNNFYTLGGEGWNMKFQLGWVGGCMVTYPLSMIGQPLSRERSLKNYNRVITESQTKSGFYYSCSNGTAWCSDCFWNPHPDNLLLLRKDADALYYIYKYCLSKKTINPNWQMPEVWKEPLRKFADAFVTLWKKLGQFGQFIDIETGEIKVGGSNSAAMAIGGLTLASKFENRPELIQVAKAAARYYYKNFTIKGVSCGGPSEILQNNDSESSFAMLESFMALYEVTGEKEWLKYAEDAAAFCSTWMVSYDYKFPSASVFGKLDMKTTGAVWASTQNKHGGPGICTLSGDCLFRLYRATGNKLYINMVHDLAHNIMQYISRDDRPISDQHSGWINERVNMSDWEGKGQVGGLFHGNTWAQVSAMLTVAEIPGIYINPVKEELVVFDHVEASLKENRLTISNPTQFDANIIVFIDKDLSKPYPQGFVSSCPKVFVKAGTTEVFTVNGNELIKK
ncbi:MAG: hypothetical protein HXX14_03475 [Bacteroidetes bacterium]|nr:hypothetical protein [Bacteroidota bacterium]